MTSSLKPLVMRYFEEHPEARDGVMKAFFAYHAPHFRLNLKAHNFPGTLRSSCCVWCGRSREMVRWDDLPPECLKRPNAPEIVDVICGEEKRSFALFKRAEKEVPKLISQMGMSGETLAVLHQTHGFDPETVSIIVEVPPAMISEYNASMETERARSRAAQTKEVIAVTRNEAARNSNTAALNNSTRKETRP